MDCVLLIRAADQMFEQNDLAFNEKTEMSDVSAYGSKQRYLLRECFWLIVITEEWTMRKTHFEVSYGKI